MVSKKNAMSMMMSQRVTTASTPSPAEKNAVGKKNKKKPAKTPGEPEKQWSTEDIEAWAVVEITDAEVQVPAGTPLFGPQKYLGANPHLIVTLTVTLRYYHTPYEC